MADYVLEGEKWGSSTFGSAGGNITWAVESSVPAALVAQISAAFTDWATYANITFTQISSTVSAKIAFSLSYIDGLDNVLGDTSYSYIGASLQSADITFDSSEGWHTSGSKVVSSDGANFFVVALHEIGHSLGMDHFNDSPAVMNAYLSSTVTDLMRSDIDGIRAIYGSATAASVFGSVSHSILSAGGEVYAFYDGILGRQPDTLGMEYWAHQVDKGLSIHDLSQLFLQSAEGQSRYAGTTSVQFVNDLYTDVLHRTGDAAGVNQWADLLSQGISRADVAAGFVLSAEHASDLSSALSLGVYAPDQNAAEVARLYYGLLGRTPDANGLNFWKGLLQDGISLHDVTQGIINTEEFHVLGRTSDAAFIEGLYEGALGRPMDANGSQFWGALLQHGASRADVAIGIAESAEAQQHLMPSIETGWHLA